MRWSRQPPIPFITENRRRRPRLRKGRKGKRRGMSRCWLPSRETLWHPESLKDKAQGKCLTCRQAGHWAKECPKHDKSPKMVCYKCHQLGHWAALCSRDPRASRSSAKPHDGSTGLKQPTPASRLSQITITALEPRVKLDVAGRLRISCLTQGQPTLS